jgi:hypothetical protein
MNFLEAMFAPRVASTPATVDEAIADLTVSLENLAAVSIDRRAAAADMFAQSKALAEVAAEHEAEADRADRIHGNIATLLK